MSKFDEIYSKLSENLIIEQPGQVMTGAVPSAMSKTGEEDPSQQQQGPEQQTQGQQQAPAGDAPQSGTTQEAPQTQSAPQVDYDGLNNVLNKIGAKGLEEYIMQSTNDPKATETIMNGLLSFQPSQQPQQAGTQQNPQVQNAVNNALGR